MMTSRTRSETNWARQRPGGLRNRASCRRRPGDQRHAGRHCAHALRRRGVVEREHASGPRQREGDGQAQDMPADRQAVEIPGAKAQIYVLGPPHDPKLIRKINPSTSSPETYALAPNGAGALSRGVIQALDSREKAGDPAAPILDDPMAPFHQRVTIPLGQKGRPWLPDSRAINEKDWRKIDDFFREHYAGSDTSQSEDWRRIDGDWLGSAAELALALQSYTNNKNLVLALELGEAGEGDMLLFAADAQVGNWESWQTWQCEVNGRTVSWARYSEANDLLQGRAPRQP